MKLNHMDWLNETREHVVEHIIKDKDQGSPKEWGSLG